MHTLARFFEFQKAVVKQGVRYSVHAALDNRGCRDTIRAPLDDRDTVRVADDCLEDHRNHVLVAGLQKASRSLDVLVGSSLSLKSTIGG